MRKPWWIATGVLVVLAVLLAIGIPAFLPPTPGVTYANYSRVEKGMTRAEVEALLGKPDKVEALLGKPDMVAAPTRWSWDSADADHLWINFDENGRVEHSAWNATPEDRTALDRLRDRVPFLARKPPPRIDWFYVN